MAAESHRANCVKIREMSVSLLSFLKTFISYKCTLLTIEEASCSLLLAVGFWLQGEVQGRRNHFPHKACSGRDYLFFLTADKNESESLVSAGITKFVLLFLRMNTIQYLLYPFLKNTVLFSQTTNKFIC